MISFIYRGLYSRLSPEGIGREIEILEGLRGRLNRVKADAARAAYFEATGREYSGDAGDENSSGVSPLYDAIAEGPG